MTSETTQTTVEGGIDQTSPSPTALAGLSLVQESTPLAALQSSLAEKTTSGSSFEDVEENPMLVIETGNPKYKSEICFHVQLFADGCLDCKHLVENADIEYSKCHFTQGNANCPAAYFRIEFVSERVKWEKKIAKLADLPAGIDRTNLKLKLIDEARNLEGQDLRVHILTQLGL